MRSGKGKTGSYVHMSLVDNAALRRQKAIAGCRTCLLASSPSPGVTLFPTLPRTQTTSSSDVATLRCTSDSARPACHVTKPLLPGIACTEHTGRQRGGPMFLSNLTLGS